MKVMVMRFVAADDDKDEDYDDDFEPIDVDDGR